MVSNNPPRGRFPDRDGPKGPDGLRRLSNGQSNGLSAKQGNLHKPSNPLKPVKPIAQSHDGDQFLTEQPSLSQGPPKTSNDQPDDQSREQPAGKDNRQAKGDQSPDSQKPGKPNNANSHKSPANPKLRLVGGPTAERANRPVRTTQARRQSQANLKLASDLKRDYSPRTPFGSDQPAASTIAASGVMVDLSPIGQPITAATDPRWVLALRTAESLQGSVLPPEKRQKLIRLGKVMGMTAFDANLVIAIIQDQARRGYAADYCPTAGEPQLQMVPLPRLTSVIHNFAGRRALMLACAIATVLAAEIIFFKWWLGA